MEEKYQIVSFDRSQLSDFYDWILPDVYTELLGTEDFAQEGVIAVGALRAGTPCGAAVCVYAGGDAYSLISIMMDESERRQGGGLLLLNAAVNEALWQTDWEDETPPVKRLELAAEYAMREEEIEAMDRFLSAYGFRDFTELPPVFLWNAADAGQELTALTPFTQLPDEGLALCASLEENDISPEPELSFYCGDAQDAPLVFVTDPAGDQTYFVTSDSFGQVERSDFAQAFLTVLKKIGDTDPAATVITPAASNAYADTLEQLAREKGAVCLHRQAFCYVLLQMEGDKQ